MPLTGPVLVTTDLSEPADEALRQGHALARALGSRAIFCHVLPDLSHVRVLFPQFADAGGEAAVALATRARAAVGGRVNAVLQHAVEDDEVIIETGSPYVGIRVAAERIGAGVVVLGPGATPARVAHHASWAVLVARQAPQGRDILAATDFSDPALPAIETAVAEAARRGLPLRVMHAIEIDLGVSAAALGAPMPLPVSPDMFETLAESARSRLRDALDAFHATGETIVARGPAAMNIIAAAAKPRASLVVVGTHGRTGLRRLLLGSVAEAVIREAPCSVLAVPLNKVIGTPEVAAA